MKFKIGDSVVVKEGTTFAGKDISGYTGFVHDVWATGGSHGEHQYHVKLAPNQLGAGFLIFGEHQLEYDVLDQLAHLG